MREILEEFIDWLSEKDDIFYAFDNPEEAVSEFLEEKENQ